MLTFLKLTARAQSIYREVYGVCKYQVESLKISLKILDDIGAFNDMNRVCVRLENNYQAMATEKFGHVFKHLFLFVHVLAQQIY